MTKTATKRKLNPKSKAAQIRKLFEQGNLTPKEIGAKVGSPVPYVYVVRSKMKAEAGGLPSVSTKSPMPDRKSTRLNSSHVSESRMPSSA